MWKRLDSEQFKFSNDKATIVITHSSYEERCQAIARLIDESSDIYSSHIFFSKNLLDNKKYKANHQEVVDLLGQRGEVNCYPIDSPGSLLDEIHTLDARIVEFGKSCNVLFDITTFPRERMAMVLDLLLRKVPPENLYFS